MPVDRVWFLTWRTYGTRLPGSEDGFVSPVRNAAGEAEIHNIPGTRMDSDSPHLAAWSSRQLRAQPLALIREQAWILADQMFETSTIRNWTPLALAIVPNHVHLVVGVGGDPDPEVLLRDYKSYGSRALNRSFTRPKSGTWWVESGSTRILDSEAAVFGAVRYTIEQEGALVIWTAEIPELGLKRGYLVR